MRERFILQLDSNADRAHWMVIDEAGIGIGHAGDGNLAAAAEAVGGRRCIVVVPGNDVLLSQVKMPASNRKQLLQALPYALEEQLADDPEDLHFAPAPEKLNGTVYAAIVGVEQMNSWQSRLSDAGIHPDWLTPETLLLKDEPGRWQVAVDAEHAIVRTGPWAGFAVEREALPLYLELALAGDEDTRPEAVEITSYSSEPVDLPAEVSGVELVINDQSVTESLLSAIVRGLDENTTLNLLQGIYSHTEKLGKILKPWRPVAILLVAWLLLQLGVNAWENHRLDAESTRLQEEIIATYRDTFPDARNIVNPRVQMESALNKLRKASGQSGGGLLELLAISGKALNAERGLTLHSAHFRNGELIMEVNTRGIQLIDKFKQQLDGIGSLEVDLQSASASPDGAVGRISVKQRR